MDILYNDDYKKVSDDIRRRAIKFARKRLKSIGVTHYRGRHIFAQTNENILLCYFEKLNTPCVSDYIRVMKYKSSNDIGFIYFFTNMEYGFCKIGFSTNPHKRLNNVQTGCPFSISVHHILKGTKEDEKITHKKFKKYKSNGEWFFIKGDLDKYLSENNNTALS